MERMRSKIGGAPPPCSQSRNQVDVTPEMRVFHSLFLKRIKILHFPAFSK